MSNAQPSIRERFRQMAWWPSIHGQRLGSEITPPQLPEPVPLPGCLDELRSDVIADPDNDAPRIAYARECERLGDHARARFIDASLHDDSDALPWPSEWLRELEAWAVRDPIWRRGFVEGVTVTGRCFISLGESLLRAAPIRQVRLVAIRPYLDALARCRHLEQIQRLELRNAHIGPDGLRTLCGSPHIGTLRSLNLTGNNLGDSGVDHLRTNQWTDLDLTNNRLTRPVIDDTLVTLNLSGNPLEHVTRHLCGKRLRHLNLARCNLRREMLPDFQIMPLETLDLSDNPLAGTLSDWALPAVSALNLSQTHLHSLNGLDRLDRLDSLSLAENHLSDVDLEKFDLPGLRMIDLRSNRLTRMPFRSSRWVELRLSNNHLGDTGTRALLDALTCPTPRRLDLAWNGLTDTALTALAECPHLSRVTELDLSGNLFGWPGAEALARSSSLVQLRSLIVRNCPRLHSDAVARLRERYPNVAIRPAS